MTDRRINLQFETGTMAGLSVRASAGSPRVSLRLDRGDPPPPSRLQKAWGMLWRFGAICGQLREWFEPIAAWRGRSEGIAGRQT